MCKIGYKARLKCEFTELNDYPGESDNGLGKYVLQERNIETERQRESVAHPEDVHMQTRSHL